MTRLQRNLIFSLWALLVVSMIALVGLWGSWRAPRASLGVPVPEFSLIDQEGRPFARKDLAGHTWVACFVFSRCAGPCPAMMQRMARIQQAVAGADVRLVSFTVDPAFDSPEVLKEYGRKYGASDASRWTLATGSVQDLHDLAAKMLVGVRPASEEAALEHGTWLLLIDADGRIHNAYSGQDDEGWKRLADDALALSRGRR